MEPPPRGGIRVSRVDRTSSPSVGLASPELARRSALRQTGEANSPPGLLVWFPGCAPSFSPHCSCDRVRLTPMPRGGSPPRAWRGLSRPPRSAFEGPRIGFKPILMALEGRSDRFRTEKMALGRGSDWFRTKKMALRGQTRVVVTSRMRQGEANGGGRRLAARCGGGVEAETARASSHGQADPDPAALRHVAPHLRGHWRKPRPTAVPPPTRDDNRRLSEEGRRRG